MKKLFFVLLIGMACMLGAAESPFKKGTTYLNFNLCFIEKPRNGIVNPEIFNFLMGGESSQFISDYPKFQSLATGMALEFGLTNNLSLEFQYHERSFEYRVFSVIYGNDEFFRDFQVKFKERVLSLGGNYHLNFIGIRHLDVYTGFQLGIRAKYKMVQSDFKRLPQYDPLKPEREVLYSPISLEYPEHLAIYSHIAAGLNYFITDKIAINLRSGLEIGTGGYASVFFYGAGLTLKL